MKKSKLIKLIAPVTICSILLIGTVFFASKNMYKASAASVYTAWNASTIYYEGDVVSHNGKNWIAMWYTQDQEPGTTGQWGVWQEYASSDIDSTVTASAATQITDYAVWNASTIYNSGDIVSYNNKNWIAGWYTVNDEPGTTGQWGVWQEYISATSSPTATATSSTTVAPTEETTVTATPKPATTTYEKMIANSLISTGNNYRIKKTIKKAQNGEDVTIACIGGSITEGACATTTTKCYAYQTYTLFKEKYGKGNGENVHFVNAGMSGTPSSLGVIRYNRDVEQKAATQPDIVIVEFAVNDADDVTKGDTYESLVRNIWNADNDPAVILLFSVFQSQWNLQDRFIPIGNDYDLPMVSIKNAVVPEINSNRMTNAEFFASDGWHPLDYGHKIMADCLMNLFYQIEYETQDMDITLPSTPTIGKSYEGIKMVDSASSISGVTVNAGGFSTKDTNTGTFQFDNTLKFANTWKHASNASSTSFTMNLTSKNLLFVYKLSSSTAAGKADIYVDDKLVTTVNSYSSGGWNNPQTIELFNNTSAAQHKIEIKMADGDSSKEFTILGFGFAK